MHACAYRLIGIYHLKHPTGSKVYIEHTHICLKRQIQCSDIRSTLRNHSVGYNNGNQVTILANKRNKQTNKHVNKTSKQKVRSTNTAGSRDWVIRGQPLELEVYFEEWMEQQCMSHNFVHGEVCCQADSSHNHTNTHTHTDEQTQVKWR